MYRIRLRPEKAQVPRENKLYTTPGTCSRSAWLQPPGAVWYRDVVKCSRWRGGWGVGHAWF